MLKLSEQQRKAYRYCRQLANRHYENFPVASRLMSREMRPAVAAIYAFARTADDIADEGQATTEQRLKQMLEIEAKLHDIQYGKPPTEPIYIALKHAIDYFALPIQPLYDLTTAFRQDILKNRYQNFSEIKDYCQYSANPIGQLLLHLTGLATHSNIQKSNAICTSLQLINFMQDIHEDWIKRNRCYLPIDEMQKFKVSLDDLGCRLPNNNLQKLIDYQVARIEKIFKPGVDLKIPGLLGIEVNFIILCGLRTLKKLKHNTTNLYLSKFDFFKLALQSIWQTATPKWAHF